jgi:hypothetical protein
VNAGVQPAPLPDGLPANAEHVSVMGVDYVRLCYPAGDEIYLTAHGLPCFAQLDPACFWTDHDWFKANSRRLSGTSTLYRIRTKPARGQARDIVLKWNRVGQEVVREEDLLDALPGEFNSPYEEFSLVYDLRSHRCAEGRRISTHRPLAIYVPGKTRSPERLGRKDWLMEPKVAAHKEVSLDILRNYAVIYEWIEGIDAAEASSLGILSTSDMEALVSRAAAEMREAGFVVGDNKPQHVIVRPDDSGHLAALRDGRPLYGLVDFELLARTPEHERERRETRRRTYLVKQTERFAGRPGRALPPHLSATTVLGVDYIYGQVSTTGGALWVVGKEPTLFDYFLPENWEGTPRKRLSQTHGMYYTLTRDHIHIVWALSHVGQKPDADPMRPGGRRILQYGYNSPFEKFALALELRAQGVPTIYPRAIYMAGEGSPLPEEMRDERRYDDHAGLKTPDGAAVLRPDRDYFMIWGYWNGPDEKLASMDGDYYEGVSALHAYRCGLLDLEEYTALMDWHRTRMAAAGFEDLSLGGKHLLLSLHGGGELLRDDAGRPEVVVCNFELLRRVPPAPRH